MTLPSSPVYSVSDGGMISEQWIGEDVERSGHGLIWGTILPFAWGVWGSPWKISVRLLEYWNGRYRNSVWVSGLDSTGTGICDHSDELGVCKSVEFLDQLNECQLFKNSHASMEFGSHILHPSA
jgi:hypothetical protein